jgi:hypothetical protein
MKGTKIDTWHDEFKFLFLSSYGTHKKWILTLLWMLHISNMTYGKRFDSLHKQDMQFILFSFPSHKLFIRLMNHFTSLHVFDEMNYGSIEIINPHCKAVYTNHGTVSCYDYGIVNETLCMFFALATFIFLMIRFCLFRNF